MKNTQALYIFYEKNGIVRDDVLYYLKELNKEISNILVIVNGKITPQGRLKLEKEGYDILVRENKGLDFGGWKAGIEYLGWKKIQQLDGLLLCNCTCYGPIYPFNEMFRTMSEKDCDFWGINRHPEMNIYLVPGDNRSKILEHIQSYFLFFKPHLLKSNHFKKWWDELIEYSDYNYEVGLHETKFTAYLENAGYKSATYMDFEKYKKLLNDNASLLLADEQLIRDRNPLVKRRVFFLNNEQWMNCCLGKIAKKILEYLLDCTTYNIDMIWNDLLSTQKMSVLRNNLHLNYYLPKDKKITKKTTKCKIGLVFFVYYDDLIENCISYIKSIPQYSNVYIISAKKDLLQVYKDKLKNCIFNVEYRLMENRGRDVAAYLVAASDVYSKNDYICCVHDKKTAQVQYLSGSDFAYHCFENTLASPEFVENIITTFENNSKLGMLIPPIIIEGDFYPTLGLEMGNNLAQYKELYKKLKFTIPFDEDLVSPFGTMFWVRGKAFKSIFNYTWKYADFPEEPLPTDGTILHAIERIYGYAVQNDGYYVAWCATTNYISMYLDNLIYSHRELNKIIHKYVGIFNFSSTLFFLKNALTYHENTIAANNVTKANRIMKKGLQLQKLKYKILENITFGRLKKHYKYKKWICKQLLKG